MNIKLVKLITGEEMIADVTAGTSSGKTTLMNPVAIIPQMEGVAMVPFPPLSSQREIEVSNEHIVWDATVSEDAYNAYNSKFGSGIVVAQAGADGGIIT